MLNDAPCIHVESTAGGELLEAGGRIDTESLPSFEDALRKASELDRVVIDLADLDYLCSWGFGVLVDNAQKISSRGGHVAGVRPQTRLKRLFRLLHLEDLLPCADERKAAFDLLENESS